MEEQTKTKRARVGSQVQKHRACDECRSRKLACSKEPEGCSRCRREGIACHYSPQKRMGRPRKGRPVESSPDADRRPLQDDALFEPVTLAPAPAPVSVPVPALSQDSESISQLPMPLDPDLGFLDQQGNMANMDFWDLLPSSFTNNIFQDPQIMFAGDGDAFQDPVYSFGINGDEVMESNELNIKTPNVDRAQASTITRDLSDSLQRYLASRTSQPSASPLEPPESTPSDCISSPATSPQTPLQCASQCNNSSRHSLLPNLRPVPNVSCGCTSSLYLALDSLSHLPQDDIPGAIRAVRGVTKVAFDVIDCPRCMSCHFSAHEHIAPPMQAFQNMMLLAALLPSACNAYASILEMVDVAASSAKDEGRDIWFSFKDVGGLWANVADEENAASSRVQMYNNRDLDSDTWRTTIRAILRLDVWGLPPQPKDPATATATAGLQHRGLRDVVVSLEDRSKKRHDALDAQVNKGQPPKHQQSIMFPGPYRSVPVEQRTCHRILDSARVALNNLVIT